MTIFICLGPTSPSDSSDSPSREARDRQTDATLYAEPTLHSFASVSRFMTGIVLRFYFAVLCFAQGYGLAPR
ncbi:MAG: hypothetical protein Q7R88_03000 [bacterium]|nr:hypothetical protein [bacterium]